MKAKRMTAAVAVALGLAATGVSANPMFIDLSALSYGPAADAYATMFDVPMIDGDNETGVFTEFGFTQLRATSVYDYSDGSFFGSFVDTNIASELDFYNVPASGTALDGVTTVNLTDPVVPGQIDIESLAPLTNLDDLEGFDLTWELVTEYSFTGNLTAGGPQYTGGTFDVIFRDRGAFSPNPGFSEVVLSGTLTSSQVVGVGLILNFDVTSALDGFLFVQNEATGAFVNAGNSLSDVSLRLDTNIDPPVPTLDQLLVVVDDDGVEQAIRQTFLDGTVTARVPAPGVLSLMGIALLGFGAARRRKA